MRYVGIMQTSASGQAIEDPPIARALFGDVRWAWIWLIVRLYVGWDWLSEGINKAQTPSWVGDQAGAFLTKWITAALCTNFGAPLATLTALTLTAAGGAGSGATITPLILQTLSSASVVAGGAGWGTATAPARVDTVGGGVGAVTNSTPAAGFANPAVDMSGFVIRGSSPQGTTNAGGTITTVSSFPNGNGLFVAAPTAAIASGGTIPTTLASITFVMGTATDTIFLQNL